VHSPPTPDWAEFTIMMECTPESGHCQSICTHSSVMWHAQYSTNHRLSTLPELGRAGRVLGQLSTAFGLCGSKSRHNKSRIPSGNNSGKEIDFGLSSVGHSSSTFSEV